MCLIEERKHLRSTEKQADSERILGRGRGRSRRRIFRVRNQHGRREHEAFEVFEGLADASGRGLRCLGLLSG